MRAVKPSGKRAWITARTLTASSGARSCRGGPQSVYLTGPTNTGLADPGHGTLISLLQMTIDLILFGRPSAEGSPHVTAMVTALGQLVDEPATNSCACIVRSRRRRSTYFESRMWQPKGGVTPDASRFYEREGLLPPPLWTSSGYRQFDEGAVRYVRFIKSAQSLSLKLAEIRELLEIQDEGACPCGHTSRVVERRIAELDQEIRELQRLRSDLESMNELECLMTEQSVGGLWPCEAEFVKRGGE